MVWGTVSDKIIAKIDPAMKPVKEKYTNCTWKTLYVDEDGIEKEKAILATTIFVMEDIIFRKY